MNYNKLKSYLISEHRPAIINFKEIHNKDLFSFKKNLEIITGKNWKFSYVGPGEKESIEKENQIFICAKNSRVSPDFTSEKYSYIYVVESINEIQDDTKLWDKCKDNYIGAR